MGVRRLTLRVVNPTRIIGTIAQLALPRSGVCCNRKNGQYRWDLPGLPDSPATGAVIADREVVRKRRVVPEAVVEKVRVDGESLLHIRPAGRKTRRRRCVVFVELPSRGFEIFTSGDVKILANTEEENSPKLVVLAMKAGSIAVFRWKRAQIDLECSERSLSFGNRTVSLDGRGPKLVPLDEQARSELSDTAFREYCGRVHKRVCREEIGVEDEDGGNLIPFSIPQI